VPKYHTMKVYRGHEGKAPHILHLRIYYRLSASPSSYFNPITERAPCIYLLGSWMDPSLTRCDGKDVNAIILAGIYYINGKKTEKVQETMLHSGIIH
jgi:hypothetical protein